MACEICGNTFCETSRTCTKCNPIQYYSKPNPKTREASEKAGEGIAKLFLWLAGNKYLAFVWFWITWMVTAILIGQSFGIINRADGEADPTWFNLIAVLAPVIIAIVFRKAIMKYVPKVMTAIVTFGMMAVYVAFLILIIVIAYRLLF